MGNKKSGNPVDTAAKIAPLDNKAYEKALRKLHVELGETAALGGTQRTESVHCL